MKKKFITLITVLTLTSLLLAGCQGIPQNTPANAAGLKVLAVETFLADIAQNVAGDRLPVEALMPLGVDPHAFEPTPQDVAKISQSQVLIVNGAGFEAWLNETIQNAGGQRSVIEAAAGLTSRTAREGETAVMTPQERADQLCADLAGVSAVEEISTGTTAANANELHAEDENEESEHNHEIELINLILNQGEAGYDGYLLLDTHEAGDYLIASASGEIKILTEDGSTVQSEATFSPDCAGLAQGLVVELEKGVFTLALSGFSTESTPIIAGMASGSHHHEGDPHFWLDPLLVIKYVENIRDGLIAADPTGKDTYTQNAAAYITQLNKLDSWIKQQVSTIPVERRLIVTNHESFGYFADRYGFTIIGTIVPSVSSEASPSAQQMTRLVDHIRQTGATAIFLETGSNPQLAEQIAQETGIKVVTDLYSHSISAPGGKAPTYIEMMKYNVQTIVEALR